MKKVAKKKKLVIENGLYTPRRIPPRIVKVTEFLNKAKPGKVYTTRTVCLAMKVGDLNNDMTHPALEPYSILRNVEVNGRRSWNRLWGNKKTIADIRAGKFEL
jgi:hypothetical protein